MTYQKEDLKTSSFEKESENSSSFDEKEQSSKKDSTFEDTKLINEKIE